MKKLIALLIITTLCFSACDKPKVDNKFIGIRLLKIDANTRKVETLCAQHLTAMSNFDTVALDQILDENVQYIGTDPKEMWGKAQIITYMHKAHKPDREPLALSLTSRSIKMMSDSSAIVTEHLINESLSKKIQSRITYLVNNTDGKWTITYVCWSLAPKNEDLKAIDEAVNVL